MCQDPKISGILDLQDLGSDILQDLGSYIFIFSGDLGDLVSLRQHCRGILGIMDLGQKIFCQILEILDPACVSYRGILRVLDLTQQHVIVS